ncbi:MAG TPA: terpene synthase family protein [Chloroflexota bacterium]|jgi:hypothetical protein|nr:terpene synthase family protein [Chloroflexota bacterium]
MENTSDASPWAGLRSKFLEALDSQEQVHIFDLSARMVPPLHRWAARYPLIRRVRVWPLSLSVAAAAPFCSSEALVAEARVSLWVFTLDDLFDEERVPQTELMKRAERYRAIAQNQPTAPAPDSLANALREIRDELSTYPLFASLGDEWARALCGTIDGMTREYFWRLSYRKDGGAALPTYDEYVANGLYSIGGPPHMWSAIIATGDLSAVDHIEELRQMERLSSTCIRLANDLQSYAKEITEEKINALILISRELQDQGIPEKEALERAESRVKAEIAAGIETLGEMQAKVRTKTGHPEAALADIARFVCDFYTKHDYHTFYTEPLKPAAPAQTPVRRKAAAL